MGICRDFLNWLGPDTSVNVFSCLDDPGDLVRASAVSRSWRKFVIANGFCKEFCKGKFPEVASFRNVVEIGSLKKPTDVGSSSVPEWENLEREHRAYAYLARHLMSPLTENGCIRWSVSASSTDNYPEERIENTLFPDQIVDRPSYWSSAGESNPEIPESLTYVLSSKLCVVHEIKMRPFEAYFHHGRPIYSARAVRFKMGYLKAPRRLRNQILDEFMHSYTSSDANYVWTHVSPEFPMKQDKSLQTFKLPRPVLCLGDILQIELLGRVQKCDIDGLYYICVSHVEVVGRPLSTVRGVSILDTTWQFVLKYDSEPKPSVPRSLLFTSDGEETWPSDRQKCLASIRRICGAR